MTPPKLKDRVLRLIYAQIGHRQTRYLVRALSNLPADKTRPFFSVLFAERKASWQQSLR
jgi:hypothetical protein